MSRKRKIFLTFSIVGIILIAILVLYFVFRVSKITVAYQLSSIDYQKPTQNEINKQVDEIINDSGFRVGNIILFESKQKAIENIQKNNKEIKVVGIEKIFPGRISITVYKKPGLYSLKVEDNKFAIIDEDFQLIRLDNKENKNFIPINGVEITTQDLNKEETAKQLEFKKVEKIIRSLQTNFNFSKKANNQDIIQNREKYLNFVKSINLNDKNQIDILTKQGITLRYDLNIENISDLISASIDYCKNPELEKYLMNIKNSEATGIKKTKYIIIFKTIKDDLNNIKVKSEIIEE